MTRTGKTLLMLRGGRHKEFAYQTLFEHGYRLVAVDTATSVSASLASAVELINDIYDTDEMVDAAMKLRRTVGFDGVGTFMNSPVPAVGRLSDTLGLDYFPESAGMVLASKLEVRRVLANAGVDRVRHRRVDSAEDLSAGMTEFGLPLVVKPVDNASSSGVVIVRHVEELEDGFRQALAASHAGIVMAEEYLPGHEFCAEVLVVDGRSFVLALSDKYVYEDDHSVEVTDLTPSQLDAGTQRAAGEFLAEVIRALGLRNWLVHIELRIGPSGAMHIVEVNPRAAGHKLLESVYHLRGVNPYLLLFDVLTGDPPGAADLEELLARPWPAYTAFHALLGPVGPGRVTSLGDLAACTARFEDPRERLEMWIDRGSWIGPVVSCHERRGVLYLFGDDPAALRGRAASIADAVVAGIRMDDRLERGMQ